MLNTGRNRVQDFATIWSQPAALGLTALTTAALSPLITKEALIWIWGVATLIGLFAALRVEAIDLSRWLKRLAGAALLGAGALHLARFMPIDPVVWAVEIGLLVCGSMFLWLARGTVLKPASAQAA